MNWKIFIQALDKDERENLLSELIRPLERETKLTPTNEWINLLNCSMRLRNVLLTHRYLNNGTFAEELNLPFIELITKQDFMRSRNAGKTSWQEFILLRGF
jgi:hypothetical protein